MIIEIVAKIALYKVPCHQFTSFRTGEELNHPLMDEKIATPITAARRLRGARR
jgi:hypothetical protein